MSDWTSTRLGDLLRPSNERSSRSDQFPVLTSSRSGLHLQSEYFNRIVASKDNTGYKVIRKGQFTYRAMSDDGFFRFNRLSEQEAGIISPAYEVFECDTNQADPIFMDYLLNSCIVLSQIYGTAQGGTRLSLRLSTLSEFEAEIPPLPVQKKIAEILSGIDNTTIAIFKKKKKNDLILRQAIIDATTPHHGSSWHESRIGDVVEFQGGAQPPRSTFKFAPEAGHIRMLQIRDYKSDARATYIPLDLCKRFCDREDVMIGRYGPPNFQILRGKEGSYNVALIKAMPKDSGVLSKDYLYRFLQRGDLFVLMDTLSQRTSGQQGLDMDALKGFPMFIPDLATQDHICRSISAIESISLDLNARVQSLNHLKSGISGQLLSGRKRVTI
jgi:restriction endonuclease S subunit